VSVVQRDQAWVNTATADQIVTAQTAGELDQFLGIQTLGEPPAGREELKEWLAAASPEQVTTAYANHQLDPLLS